MLGAQFCSRTFSTFWVFSDSQNAYHPTPSFSFPPLRSSSIRLHFTANRSPLPKRVLISCHSIHGSFGSQFRNEDDPDHQFLEASILVSETVSHYRMLREGFKEEIKWQSSRRRHPMSRPKIASIGQSFLSRFPSPTIFLKISCDGDFLLPISVGEFSVEKLIASFLGDENGDCPDQFNLVKHVVERLEYKVKMVRITERVVNTYFAKLYFTKPGENDAISVDARPSDAINVANRCKAPIYVSKRILLEDAIRIGYGMGRVCDRKSTYDVLLDSAAGGPDLLTEELNLVRNIDLAVEEERYNDAALLRDKLMKLRHSSDDQ
ncbi:transformer-2 protein-like protein beta-like [Hibiscus syriacus]|uniref:Transformer-2 protein-like protein beta-like n=1 Tax=Hibiscus syriacus TaxID=106335 RepID=A0A6A2XC23_HIBSY|nr:bifunctional nuclease 2-like isoform X2 [Hibiscus syriacus]KAE8655939.1 transformer-2 protein-like protein beta-like [Hibiscus syriacus]